MSNQPGAPQRPATPPMSPPTGATSDMKKNAQPITQQKQDWRSGLPVWMRQLPSFRFSPPNPDFQLLDREKLKALLATSDRATATRIVEDIQFLDKELMRYFRDRDYEASQQQNAYRLIQIVFIVLAFLATLIGSVQALSLTNFPEWLPFFAFLETVVALAATFVSAVATREPPLPRWLNSRRRAESMRREYFRFLMNMAPYDALEGYQRRTMLSQRAADINRGVFPDDSTTN